MQFYYGIYQKVNCVVRESYETNWTSLNRKCLGEKGRKTDYPRQKTKTCKFNSSEGSRGYNTTTILLITIRPFQKNVSGKKTLFIWHAKTEKEVRSLTTWKSLQFQKCYTAMSPQSRFPVFLQGNYLTSMQGLLGLPSLWYSGQSTKKQALQHICTICNTSFWHYLPQ